MSAMLAPAEAEGSFWMTCAVFRSTIFHDCTTQFPLPSIHHFEVGASQKIASFQNFTSITRRTLAQRPSSSVEHRRADTTARSLRCRAPLGKVGKSTRRNMWTTRNRKRKSHRSQMSMCLRIFWGLDYIQHP